MAVVFHPGLNAPAHPRVSVCIANFDGEALLPACIESVLAQQGDVAIEILVHDDCSRDGSVALLRERWPQVHVIAADKNVGFCIGNNRMVARARGEYVLLLNNDAALAPDAISRLLEMAELMGTPAILTLPQHDWDTDALVDRGCLLDPFCNPIPNVDPTRDDVAYVIGACLWCPRLAWHALGGFPEWMESIGEDLHLCGLARLRGMPVRALRESRYRHRQGATFGGNRADAGLRTSIRRRRLSERNKTRALILLTPTFLAWPLLAAHLAALAIEGLALSLLRRDATLWREVYWPALATPFCEWSVLRARRNEVQATRAITVAKWFSTVRWQLRKVAMLLRYGVPTVR
ncbi:glycosyltransferase [Lysobacter sp. A6]|uniref:Glycosyltransferase n=1 Tax=Noviluteimonas lactosilytica TaxID=2888523 RepID=A0ABS8JFV7_9GAMM|nr:glycosyltransferase [Lysobacter lactosilyticus]MCC8362496.1 glycosyltransferase [Lysobacter lactosilyticus]